MCRKFIPVKENTKKISNDYKITKLLNFLFLSLKNMVVIGDNNQYIENTV